MTEQDNYYIVNVYLGGLEDEENKFIKEQMKKKLTGGAALSKDDLQVDVPAAYLIYAARKGNVFKDIKIKNEKGKVVKKLSQKEVAAYNEESDEDSQKLQDILSKGEVYITLTPAGWQETFKELMESDI